MMVKKWILALMMALFLGGCHRHRRHDHAVEDLWYLRYPNGAPILARRAASDVGGTIHEQILLNLVNDHRLAAGLNALPRGVLLSDLARAHSIHMHIHGFFDILNPEGDAPGARAMIAGIPWTGFGENISDIPDPFGTLSDWLRMPGTHETIDDPFWSEAGVGFDAGYWTIDFRHP